MLIRQSLTHLRHCSIMPKRTATTTTTTTINKVSSSCYCVIATRPNFLIFDIVTEKMTPRKKRRTTTRTQERLDEKKQEENTLSDSKKNSIPYEIPSDMTEFEVAFLKKYQFMWYNTFSPTISNDLGKARCGI